MMTEQDGVSVFIERWQGVTASELSTSQSFVIELCELLGVQRPHATPEQDYMFERPVTFAHGDGSSSAGRIDCYRRGAFIWESKKLKPGNAAAAVGATSKAFDDALLRARAQAEAYARALPASEGRPPFLVVVDVGHVIELYAEFTRSGATYTPFPDPRSHRIRLADLASDVVRQRLRALWADPLSLDPARVSARVTRRVAAELAELAKSLEAAGHPAEQVAGFLTRCLFSMFAEDVGLLPKGADGSGSFLALLKIHRDQPATLVNMLCVFWAGMDSGGFNAAIAQEVLCFNGKLFKSANASGYVLSLNEAQVDGLLRAASANWKEVEPAIFGTLLERALDPAERHALGAHYTPRAYVERLVLPTVVEPLRADWANAQAAALLLVHEAEALDGKKRDAKLVEARAEIRRFHHQLCTTRVLDPACGSGNFLYVTLEHLKRLEGEVLNQLEALGETQDKLALEGETVTLQQLRGIEINERAAALAELVLWIGWLQWHLRTRGQSSVAEPVIHDYGNIECRDAVLAYDRQEIALDANGRPITRWDGKTFKTHPVTGEDVPDETAQVPQWRYVNPRRAEWPKADFIVGNPPFIGNKRMRELLGDGYVEALRRMSPDVPDTADFVMYWWDRAASSVRSAGARGFGLITTNSLRQTFNRKVVDRHLAAKPALSIRFAIPDHPWVDSASGADVRIAMTVATSGQSTSDLLTVIDEQPDVDGERAVTFVARQGEIHADLTVGAKVGAAQRLRTNAGLSFQGMNLVGKGFRLSEDDVRALGYDSTALPEMIKPHCNARDLLRGGKYGYAIDMFGLTADEALRQHPALYQWLIDRVKPERDHNNDPQRKRDWWLFGRANTALRLAWTGLRRILLTAETAKHRVFVFQELPFCPDHKLYVICCDDPFVLGVLSSSLHALWSLRAGGTLEDRPTWTNTTTFMPFPFPLADTETLGDSRAHIATLAEQIDALRKRSQAAHAAVTLTGLYNVLDKLRRNEPLTASDKTLHEQGLVSVLRTLHDELDAAVLQAYGWSDLGPVPWAEDAARSTWTEALLERLVALNAKRAAEEAQGTVRWLRPEFQNPVKAAASAEAAAEQASIDLPDEAEQGEAGEAVVAKPAAARQPWPAALPEQMRAVAEVLATVPGTHDEAALAERFSGRGPWKKRLPKILQTLEALGRARREGESWRA